MSARAGVIPSCFCNCFQLLLFVSGQIELKRILIISYYWPPTGGSGVQRWVKFAKYLPSFGWQPVVYTPSNPERLAVDESLLKEVPPEAEIITAPIREPYAIYKKFSGKGGKAQVNPLNSQKKSLKQKLAVWVRGNFFVPDPRVGWVEPSVRFLAAYLKEHPVDVVVTTGPPQSMHLIGKGLKEATGVRWIADFRDPWTEIFYFKHMGLWPLAKRRHRKLEQEVLDGCDAVISVTPLVQKDFQAKTTTPVHLITNGYDESDFPPVEPALAEPPLSPVPASETCAGSTAAPFTLVHTGLFASDGNPLKLWDTLKALCESDEGFRKALKIKLIGKVDPEICAAIATRGLQDNLSNEGYLPHDRTVQQQRTADILLLPLRQEPEYRKVFPGKIFEYLASRRPVLGIGQEDGAAATLLRETGAGRMFDWDKEEELREFIESEWKKHLDGVQAPLRSDIEQYSRKALTAKLTGIL